MRYLEIFDRPVELRVTVRTVEGPGGDSRPSEVLNWSTFEADVSQDELLEELYRGLHDEDGRERGPYVLDTRRSHFSWGAEHVVGEIILDLAAGLVAGGVYDLLKNRLRHKNPESGGPPLPLDRAEVEQQARWLLEERFELTEEDPAILTGEKTDATMSRVELTFVTTTDEYHLIIERLAGYTTVIEASRRSRS